MPSACLRKSAYSASNCSDVIDWLPAHHMFLSVVASRTVNLSLGLRPVKSPVSAHKAPSAERTASPAATERSQSCGAPRFQCTPFSFFKPNLSAPKAPLCTPVSCTEDSSSNPRISIARNAALTRLCRGDPQYSLPAMVRRPNTDERRTCQADPVLFGLFDGRPSNCSMLHERWRDGSDIS